MFDGWGNFYFMLGSAAASLTGLMFVVATLTRSTDPAKAMRGQRIYMTPTVMQLGVVLSMSGVALAPRLTPEAHRWIMAAIAGWGLIYALPAAFKMGKGGSNITAHWSDYLFYGAAPLLVYAVLETALIDADLSRDFACNLTALSLLGLLMLSVRNAWDLVTWMAPRVNARQENPADPPALNP